MTGPYPDQAYPSPISPAGASLQAVVYAGHMPDIAPGGEKPSRFPARAQDRVARAARAAMEGFARAGAHTAFGSLAAGADIILAEAALEAGMRVHAVVPAGLERFLDASVRGFDRARPATDEEVLSWERRLHRILDNAAVTLETLPAEDDLPDHAFAAVNERILALALAAAREDGNARIQALLVLAGPPDAGKSLGGTAHFAGQLQAAQIATQIIDPTDMDRSGPAETNPAPETAQAERPAAALPPAPDLNALLPEFDRLDREAVVSQKGWRGRLHRMLLLFAVLMVLTGMEHMPSEALNGNGLTLRLIAIGATILGLGVEAGLGLKPNRTHRAWVRSRSRAETIRAAAWSRLMGFPPMALEEAAESNLDSPELDRLAARLAALPRKERWQWYSTHRLRDQAAYYTSRAHRLHTLERRLLIIRYALIVLAMIWGTLRLASEFWHGRFLDPHIFHEYHFLGVAIALVSLLHVWLESTQAERLAGRYRALSRTLTALAVKVETAPGEAEAVHAAREGEELLFAQNEEWIGVVG